MLCIWPGWPDLRADVDGNDERLNAEVRNKIRNTCAWNPLHIRHRNFNFNHRLRENCAFMFAPTLIGSRDRSARRGNYNEFHPAQKLNHERVRSKLVLLDDVLMRQNSGVIDWVQFHVPFPSGIGHMKSPCNGIGFSWPFLLKSVVKIGDETSWHSAVLRVINRIM